MKVTLPAEVEKFIQSQVDAGRFASTDQLLEEAVSRMMFEHVDQLDDETLAAISEADAQIDRGEGMDLKSFTTEFYKRIGRAPR